MKTQKIQRNHKKTSKIIKYKSYFIEKSIKKKKK